MTDATAQVLAATYPGADLSTFTPAMIGRLDKVARELALKSWIEETAKISFRFVFDSVPGLLLVEGETFAHRAALKAAGCRWNPARSCWTTNPRSYGLAFLETLARHLG